MATDLGGFGLLVYLELDPERGGGQARDLAAALFARRAAAASTTSTPSARTTTSSGGARPRVAAATAGSSPPCPLVVLIDPELEANGDHGGRELRGWPSSSRWRRAEHALRPRLHLLVHEHGAAAAAGPFLYPDPNSERADISLLLYLDPGLLLFILEFNRRSMEHHRRALKWDLGFLHVLLASPHRGMNCGGYENSEWKQAGDKSIRVSWGRHVANKQVASSLASGEMEIYFYFRTKGFFYSAEKDNFFRLRYPTKDLFWHYIKGTRFGTKTKINTAMDKWGRNM